MIISYKNNFALIAIPKCGTHSVEPAVRMSGILDPSIDICTCVYNFHNELNFEHIRVQYGKISAFVPSLSQVLPKKNTMSLSHISWTYLLEKKLVNEDMKCIAVVRHPVDRFISTVSYGVFNKQGVPRNIEINRAISTGGKGIYNCFWDNFYSSVGAVNQPRPYSGVFLNKQTSFLNDDPTVYKIENLVPRITELIESFGGEAPPIGHENKSKPRPANDRLLTKDRQQQILEFYQDDFILWEKAT